MDTVINGKFHVQRAIARGGMGRIYYGTQAPLGRPVALKILKAGSANEEESQFLKRFLLEASILAKLQHPNVVTLFDYGRIEGANVEMYFIAMEYLDGQTLTERLRTRGRLPAGETLTLLRQIARGLREVHTQEILHRDLKPSNIVIVPEADSEIVKLVDFGIGKDERHGGEDITREGVLVGTPKYMAPEQFDGDSSPASDVYALGVILYQTLTGALPFEGTSTADLMMAKLQDPIRPLREVNPDCDATDTLENLVVRMLARRANERPLLDDVFVELAHCESEALGATGARLARAAVGRVSSEAPVGPLETKGGEPSAEPRATTASYPAPPAASAASTRAGAEIIRVRSSTTPNASPRARNEGAASGALTPEDRRATDGRASTVRAASVGFVTALMLAGAAWWTRPAPTTVRVPSPPAPSTEAVASESRAVSASTSFVLHLDSAPSGAIVSEDENVLGVTPIALTVERSSVADGRTRTFQLKREGYTTVAFAQGNTNGDVRQTVPLILDPPKASKPNTAKPSVSATRPTAPDSDIRFSR